MERSRSVSDQSAVILWCDTSTAALGHWTERAKAVNQDWILSAASSKGAGLSFHISALRFDIYEHKLSANELVLLSGPQTQHRQHTHTYRLKRNVLNIAVSDLCASLSECTSAHIKQSISSASMKSKPQECWYQQFRVFLSWIGQYRWFMSDAELKYWNNSIVVWPVRRVLSWSLTDVRVIQKLHNSHFSEQLRKHRKERRSEKIINLEQELLTLYIVIISDTWK